MSLFVFGVGYTAGQYLRAREGAAAGTVRSAEKAGALRREGVEAYLFDGDGGTVDPGLEAALGRATGLLVSVQPGRAGDPVLGRFGGAIARAPDLRAIVYLSTIGVYGDHGGAWINEAAPPMPANERGRARVAAEQAWLSLAREARGVAVLRLAGIYGPGRNALADLAAGEARRIDKPGQVFNRIHVADIGRAIDRALARGESGVWNVADDEPAPAPDVVAYAAALMGVEPPPPVPFAEAELSPMARSFYGANRRVSNRALKEDLGVALGYPTYREGLRALWEAGEGR